MKATQEWMPEDYARIEKAIEFLQQHYRDQPTLDEIARRVHLSKFHFQRMFSRWAGISPKRFIQYLTLSHAKALLAASHSVLDASLDAGLSGPGRLHDLFIAAESVTPGEFKRQGRELTVRYGRHPSPFGECLLALSDKGVCGLAFAGTSAGAGAGAGAGGAGAGAEAALADLRARWPLAHLEHDDDAVAAVARRVFHGGGGGGGAGGAPLRLHLLGTNFQLKVWEALLRIPPGAVASYQDLAGLVGKPGASRAAGRAVAQNPVAYLIPCHRVIRKSGDFGEYRWGAVRKKAMLAWEACRAERLAG